MRAGTAARKYRIRWLGLPPKRYSWEPRYSLPHDVPEVVWAYEPMDSEHIDATADVNVLVVKENGKEAQDVKNRNCAVIHGVECENDGKTENLVVSVYHNDYEKETSMTSTQQDGQTKSSPTCDEHLAEINSSAESGDARKAHRKQPQPLRTKSS